MVLMAKALRVVSVMEMARASWQLNFEDEAPGGDNISLGGCFQASLSDVF
jgi:hypothetical protein